MVRNYGIDLLKILAMFMVIVLHILGQGGVLKNLTPTLFFSKYSIAWFIEIGAYCAVNCYAIITGYNYYERSVKWNKLLILWLQVAFYSIGITAIFLMYGTHINSSIWFKTLLPVISASYWYVTAYFGMCLFIPMMNNFLFNAEKKKIELTLFLFFIILSVLPTLFNVDPFKLNRGYSMIWICILYLIGGYLKKHNIQDHLSSSKALLYYVCAVILTWCSKVGIEFLSYEFLGKIKYGNVFIKYTSPTIILAAVFLFLGLAKLKITNEKIIKMIGILSPAAFGVYLIHLHPLIWSRVIKNFAVSFTKMSCIEMLSTVFGVAILAYLVLSVIDMLRMKIFSILNINKKTERFCTYVKEKLLHTKLM